MNRTVRKLNHLIAVTDDVAAVVDILNESDLLAKDALKSDISSNSICLLGDDDGATSEDDDSKTFDDDDDDDKLDTHVFKTSSAEVVVCKVGDGILVGKRLPSKPLISEYLLSFEDEEGLVPLHMACRYGRLKTIKLMLDRGMGSRHATKSMEEVCCANLSTMTVPELTQLVDLLVGVGADIHARDVCSRPLWYEAATDNHRLARALLRTWMRRPQLYNWCKETPLHLTAVCGFVEETEALLKMGMDPNVQNLLGVTPLYWAVDNEHVQVVRVLLEHGADPNLSCYDEYYGEARTYPLFPAGKFRHKDIFKLLLEYGADVNVTNLYDEDVLSYAGYNEGRDFDDCATMLLKHDLDLDRVDIEGRTMLQRACHLGHVDLAKHLLERGDNVDVQDNCGLTALMLAVTPCSSSFGNPFGDPCNEILRLLVEYGANVNLQDENGKTVLHIVAEKGLPENAAIIMSANPDLSIQNRSGMTALDVAKSSSDFPDMFSTIAESQVQPQARQKRRKTNH